jgi:peptidoglycan/xylan/chitin deacetylase (PgdA/CDA1 family)
MLLALNYHRIGRIQPDGDVWELTVSQELFSSHLAVLKQNFEIADPRTDSLAALAQCKRELVLVTFDDGYADNLHVALPLLEQQRVPATIFLASGYVGKPYFWWDAVETIFHPAAENVTTPDTTRLQSVWSCLLRQAPSQREFEVKELLHLSGDRRVDPSCRPLKRQEVLDLARSSWITFGGHSRTHPWLPHLSSDDRAREVEGGMQENAALTNREQIAFAYPFGAVCPESRKAVAQAGYSIAFTTAPPSHDWDGDLLAHPRLIVGNWSSSEFHNRLQRILVS